jgi:hypothetical protein
MSSCKELPRRFRQKVVVVAVMTKQRPFRMPSSLDRTPMGKYRRSLVCFRYCLLQERPERYRSLLHIGPRMHSPRLTSDPAFWRRLIQPHPPFGQ